MMSGFWSQSTFLTQLSELSAYRLYARPTDNEGKLVFHHMFVHVGNRTESALDVIQSLGKSLDLSSESRDDMSHDSRDCETVRSPHLAGATGRT
jgi:hypothetical protein